MREAGFSYGSIAKATGYTSAAVSYVVKDVDCPKSPSQLMSEAHKGVPRPKNRKNNTKVLGFKMGTLNRVAISFTEDQFRYLVEKKNETGDSFSKVVSDIIQFSFTKEKANISRTISKGEDR